MRLQLSDPQEQLGALQVLADYTWFRLSRPGVTPDQGTVGQTRLSEYNRMVQQTGQIAGASVAARTRALAADATFRRGVIMRFAPDAPLAAFEAAQKREENAERATQASSREATARQVAQSNAAAQRGKTDLVVFGIPLNKPLNLPACGADAPGETCRIEAGGLMQMFNQLAVMGSLKATPGTTEIQVRLAASRCPSWVSCSQPLVVGMRDGYALSVTFLTAMGESAGKVTGRISEKYRAQPKTGPEYSECRVSYRGAELGANDRALNRTWELPGLSVLFVPYGTVANCKQGGVIVTTSAYGAVVDQATQKVEAAQPKM